MKRFLCYLGVGVLALLVLTAILGPMILGRARSEVEEYKDQLRARGEVLEVAELIPKPLPADQDSTALVLDAMRRLGPIYGISQSNPPSCMKMVAPGKAIVGWMQPEIRGEASNTWAELRTELLPARETLNGLARIIGQPDFSFPLDFSKGWFMLLPHLAPIKQIAFRETIAISCDLHDQDTESATTNVQIQLALAQGLQDEPLMISQLVGIAIANIALSANWELLQATNLTDGELAALQKSWERLEFLNAMGNSLSTERAFSEMMMKRMREAGGDIRKISGGTPTSYTSSGDLLEDAKHQLANLKGAGQRVMWMAKWSQSDELRMLKGYQAAIEISRSLQTNQDPHPILATFSNRLNAVGFSAPASESAWMADLADAEGLDLRRLFSEGVYTSFNFINRALFVETAQRMTITAIGLKRYQLMHGYFPVGLANLTPNLLETVPWDPMDGRPLRYRLNPDGSFLLYSVGKDGKDDGGDPSQVDPSGDLNWRGGRDWVWPQPASDAEIESYYNKRPSQRN